MSSSKKNRWSRIIKAKRRSGHSDHHSDSGIHNCWFSALNRGIMRPLPKKILPLARSSVANSAADPMIQVPMETKIFLGHLKTTQTSPDEFTALKLVRNDQTVTRRAGRPSVRPHDRPSASRAFGTQWQGKQKAENWLPWSNLPSHKTRLFRLFWFYLRTCFAFEIPPHSIWSPTPLLLFASTSFAVGSLGYNLKQSAFFRATLATTWNWDPPFCWSISSVGVSETSGDFKQGYHVGICWSWNGGWGVLVMSLLAMKHHETRYFVPFRSKCHLDPNI